MDRGDVRGQLTEGGRGTVARAAVREGFGASGRAVPVTVAMALGARLLLAADDLDSEEGHQVYADPAGHPFCIGWGHPSRETLAAFVAGHQGR